MIVPSIQPQKPTLSGPKLREVFRLKLRYAVDMVGSINKACALIGVNRTQFNRYLNGQSMPRVELLYQFATALSLPIDWFFDPSQDFEAALSAHEYATQSGRSVAGHQFRVSEDMLPDGFYLLWKGTFDGTSEFEAMLGMVKVMNGVKSMKISKHRRMRLRGALSSFDRRDLFLDLLIERSTNGIYFSTGDGDQNHIYNFFVRLRAPFVGDRRAALYTGAGFSGSFGGVGRRSLVPVAMERIEPTRAATVAAARRVGGYKETDLPGHVREAFREIDVPEFTLN